MPFPDGSSTPSEVSEQLDRLIVVYAPRIKTTDELWPVMVREYVEALRRFPPASLRAGISRMLRDRKDKFWPTPAEISDAVRDAVGSPAQPTLKARKNDFEERDQALRDLRVNLRETFERQQAGLMRQATAEGWSGLLDTAIRNAANILAQREMKRREGAELVYPCPFPNIAMIDGAEQIAIDHAEIGKWRGYFGFGKESAAA